MMKTATKIHLIALAATTVMLAACGGGDPLPEQQAAADGIVRTPQTPPSESNLSRAGFGAVTVNNIQGGTTVQGGSIP